MRWPWQKRADPSERLRTITARAFAATRAPDGASLVTTPPFPVAWPPYGPVVIYLYVTHFAPQLNDALMTSPPFARVRLDVDDDVVLEHCDPTVGATTPQGFFPITPAHPLIASSQAGVTALRAARDTPTGADADAIRTFYNAWLAANGVVAHDIRPRHEAFCAWLKG